MADARIPIHSPRTAAFYSVPQVQGVNITAEQPKGLRDAWAVLWGRKHVKVRIERVRTPNSVEGVNSVLREVWSEPKLAAMNPNAWAGAAVSVPRPKRWWHR